MQELIQWINHNDKYDAPIEAFDIVIKAIKLLEKEKEQIIDAFESGYKSCDIDEAFEINRKLASGEQYYNQKYQNK